MMVVKKNFMTDIIKMDGEHKHKQFMARMNYSTYMRLRCQFKALNRNESAKDYFLRLAKYLELLKLTPNILE